MDDQEKSRKHIEMLDTSDFEGRGFKKIFATIRSMSEEGMPYSDSLVLHRMNGQYENELLEVLAANPVSDIYPYIRALKESFVTRELAKELEKIKSGGGIDTMKIEHHLRNLQNVHGNAEATETDADFEKWLDKFDIKEEHFSEIKMEYIQDGVIVKGDITMVASPPGGGKTLIMLAMANMALLAKKVQLVVYIDLDNSLTTMADRGLKALKLNWKKQFVYIHPSIVSSSDVWSVIKRLQKVNLKDVLIVFDSAKHFMAGRDRDKNKDVSILTEEFKKLRARGGTVVFLHHTKKPQFDMSELIYSGSSAFAEDTANAFILTKNDYKKAFILTPFKARTGDLKKIAYIYDASSIKLNIVESELAEEDELFTHIKEEIIIFIDDQKEPPSYSNIMTYLTELQFSKNRVNQVLQEGKGRYWKVERLKQNNKTVFSLIKPRGDADESDK